LQFIKAKLTTLLKKSLGYEFFRAVELRLCPYEALVTEAPG